MYPGYWIPGQAQRRSISKFFGSTLKCDEEWTVLPSSEVYDSTLPRKAPTVINMVPVPRTNTRPQDENSKASEIIVAKELCKMTP